MLYKDKILEFFTNEEKLLKIIGYSDESSYNYLMKIIYDKTISNNNCKIYENGFDLPSNMDAIMVVQQSVGVMDLDNLENEEITLTSDDLLNQKIKSSIIKVIQAKLSSNSFKSNNIKSNFITKQIVWIYEKLQEFEINNNPLIILYGELNEDELYHIQILNLIGFKIMFINSSRDIAVNDLSNISENLIKLNNISPLKKYSVRVANAPNEIKEKVENQDVVTTWAKKAKEELYQELYTGSSVFRPWQFKNGTTKGLYIDAVVEDIQTYWHQEAKFRPSFKVENDIVYVPNFITKINGTYLELKKYKELVEFTKKSKLTLFKVGSTLTSPIHSVNDMYSLMFLINNDEINFEELKKHSLYKINRVNIDTQEFIIKKLNEFIKVYKGKVDMKEILNLISTVISMEDEYLSLIEKFDFPFNIPKLIIYLSDRSDFNILDGLFMNYLNLISLDILIYSPTGSPSIENHMYKNHLNIITLDDMNFDLEYNKLLEIKEKGFFKKIFNMKGV